MSYLISATINPGRRKPIVIEVEEEFTLKQASLDAGKGLTFVSAANGDNVLFDTEMGLGMALSLLNLKKPVIPKGELTLVVRNPSTKPIELSLKIE
jgi:hypothetical protein